MEPAYNGCNELQFIITTVVFPEYKSVFGDHKTKKSKPLQGC